MTSLVVIGGTALSGGKATINLTGWSGYFCASAPDATAMPSAASAAPIHFFMLPSGEDQEGTLAPKAAALQPCASLYLFPLHPGHARRSTKRTALVCRPGS